MAPDELREGAGAMADPMLLRGIQFAEGQLSALRDEHRVVAETAIATRRPGKASRDLASEELGLAVSSRQREHGDKVGVAVFVADLLVNPLHRDPEVLCRAGPAGRIDPWRAAERRHDKAGIVGERRQSARLRRGSRLQRRIGLEAVTCFFRLGKTEQSRGNRVDTEWRQQRCYLLDLARIVARDYQPCPFPFPPPQTGKG